MKLILFGKFNQSINVLPETELLATHYDSENYIRVVEKAKLENATNQYGKPCGIWRIKPYKEYDPFGLPIQNKYSIVKPIDTDLIHEIPEHSIKRNTKENVIVFFRKSNFKKYLK